MEGQIEVICKKFGLRLKANSADENPEDGGNDCTEWFIRKEGVKKPVDSNQFGEHS